MHVLLKTRCLPWLNRSFLRPMLEREEARSPPMLSCHQGPSIRAALTLRSNLIPITRSREARCRRASRALGPSEVEVSCRMWDGMGAITTTIITITSRTERTWQVQPSEVLSCLMNGARRSTIGSSCPENGEEKEVEREGDGGERLSVVSFLTIP